MVARMKARFEFKLEDFWVGVYWKKSTFVDGSTVCVYKRLDIWLCILPCFPLHITWARPGHWSEKGTT